MNIRDREGAMARRRHEENILSFSSRRSSRHRAFAVSSSVENASQGLPGDLQQLAPRAQAVAEIENAMLIGHASRWSVPVVTNFRF
jgi:hypothetical protein